MVLRRHPTLLTLGDFCLKHIIYIYLLYQIYKSYLSQRDQANPPCEMKTHEEHSHTFKLCIGK